VNPARGALEQSLAHLRSTRIVETDEQDPRH
jgi:hypothetical protein